MVEHGPSKCDAPIIQETDLQNAVIKAINLALGNRDYMITALQENVEVVIIQQDESAVEEIEGRLEELQKELLKLANTKKNYDSVADEIYRLRELKQEALLKSAKRKGLKQRISEMTDFLNSQLAEVEKYDDQLVRSLINKVKVYNDRFVVEFKSGTSVDVKR